MPKFNVSQPGSRRMPRDSAFFEHIVPVILALLAVALALVMLLAIAGVMGWIP